MQNIAFLALVAVLGLAACAPSPTFDNTPSDPESTGPSNAPPGALCDDVVPELCPR